MLDSTGHVALLLLAAFLTAPAASAHPGSAIVVDSQGQVYFIHTGVGVYKIDREGRLVRQEGAGYHFMTIDREGSFEKQRWPSFPDGVIEVVGTDPKLLLASSFPVTIGSDGALYYPEPKNDGHVHVMRLTPGGEPATYAVLPVAMEIGPGGTPLRAEFIHGLVAGPDGTLYYAEKYAVRRIDRDGSVSLVAGGMHGTRPPTASDERHGPALRGLDVAADGTVYVAAFGYGAVLEITPSGEVSAVLRASDSWTPTGVVVAGDDLYVLEFRYIEVERAEDWLPRIRRVSRDGTVTVVATVDQAPG